MSPRSSRLAAALLASAVLLAMCAGRPAGAGDAPPVVRGFETGFRDTTCAPCRDFFQFANGAWMDTANVPAAYSMWGAGEELEDRNEAALREVMDRAVADRAAAPGTNAWRLSVFCASCMDSAGAEREGSRPLDATLAEIDALKSAAELPAEVARLHAVGVNAMFGFGSEQDALNSEDVIAGVAQGGLGLPDRDYYFRTDSATVRLRDAYVDHAATLLAMLGTPGAAAREGARRILALETELARASMTRVQRRDPKAVYHRLPLREFEASTPALGWADYLAAAGAPPVSELNVQQPAFFHALDSLLKAVPLGDWKLYLRWHAASAAAPFLSSAFVDENFRFARLLTGASTQRPRWKRCLRQADGALGEVLGQEYVKTYFPPPAKARALEMVNNLKAALGDRIRQLDWMDAATKAQAEAKLAAITVKIGYPDRWRDYSALELSPGPFLANIARAQQFEWRRDMAKIGRPLDRAEWFMTPPTVNAYYNRGMNEIVFPAGILQPPYFDPSMDDAVNYAATGATIGHEMTHGFDDRGRQFDGRGNMRDWWSPQVADNYKARARLVEEQFNGFVAVDTLHVNGRLTLGENISDLGGLVIAYEALEKSLAGRPRPLIDGMTPEQRFFFAYAQEWREKRRPEYMRTLVQTDPHSPDKLRVIGPLQNLPEFRQVFGCREGDAMVRPDSLRARIW